MKEVKREKDLLKKAETDDWDVLKRRAFVTRSNETAQIIIITLAELDPLDGSLAPDFFDKLGIYGKEITTFWAYYCKCSIKKLAKVIFANICEKTLSDEEIIREFDQIPKSFVFN